MYVHKNLLYFDDILTILAYSDRIHKLKIKDYRIILKVTLYLNKLPCVCFNILSFVHSIQLKGVEELGSLSLLSV